MDTLEKLLDENYKTLKSDECKQRVIEYLRNNDTISGNDINFITTFTKVGIHILRTDQKSLDDASLLKLYSFNIEGIKKIHTGDLHDVIDNKKVNTIEAHLNGNAATMLSHIIHLTGDKSSLQSCYDHYVASADLSKGIENNYSASQYEHAGMVCRIFLKDANAQKRFKLGIKWLKNELSHYKESLELMSDCSSEDLARIHRKIANAYKDLYFPTGDASNLRKAIKFYESAIDHYSSQSSQKSIDYLKKINEEVELVNYHLFMSQPTPKCKPKPKLKIIPKNRMRLKSKHTRS